MGAVWLILNYFLVTYLAAFRVFLFFLPGMILFCLTILLAAYFSARKDLRVNLFISLLCLILITMLDILLIPAFGIAGAACAQTIAYGVSGLTSLIVFSKKESVDIFQIGRAHV